MGQIQQDAGIPRQISTGQDPLLRGRRWLLPYREQGHCILPRRVLPRPGEEGNPARRRRQDSCKGPPVDVLRRRTHLGCYISACWMALGGWYLQQRGGRATRRRLEEVARLCRGIAERQEMARRWRRS